MLPARRSCHLGEQDPDEAPREQREANPYQQGVGAPFPARPKERGQSGGQERKGEEKEDAVDKYVYGYHLTYANPDRTPVP